MTSHKFPTPDLLVSPSWLPVCSQIPRGVKGPEVQGKGWERGPGWLWTLARSNPQGLRGRNALLPDPNMSLILGGGVVRGHGWPHCPM